MEMRAVVVLFLCAVAVHCKSWVKEMENPKLWQGDIVLDPDEIEHRNGTKTFASIKGGRWPNGQIPYVITNSIGRQGVTAINAAIANYHKHTCLRFHKRTNEATYISFYAGDGCSSPVGYRYGRVNHISLGYGCWWTGTTMHEIGHSIGFFHEQSRPDRDSNVDIIWRNIEKGMGYNFNKKTTAEIDSLGTPYDFSSMMHYAADAFGINRAITIRTKDPSKQRLIGQSQGFSQIDIKQLGLMYKGICKAGGGTGGGGTGGGGTGGGGGGCIDDNNDCTGWAKGGYCTGSHGDWMQKHCCKSCKGAGGGGGSCADDNNDCAGWAKGGYCTGSHGDWMQKHCCKSCRG